MSFKRDGDDSSLLSNLQMRLVGELLSAHIPSDEARLLSNGRFTCTVCSYRPVFDTIEILAIHRAGSKHLQNLAEYLKRTNKSNSSNDESGPCAPSLLPTYRKPKPSAAQHFFSTNASPYKNTKRKKQTDRKLRLPLKPNDIMTKRIANSSDESSTVSAYLNVMTTKESLQSTITDCKEGLNRYPKCKNLYTNARSLVPLIKPQIAVAPVKRELDKEIRERNARNLELNRDGWILGSNSVWTKDDQAEFDSDQETPPLPAQ